MLINAFDDHFYAEQEYIFNLVRLRQHLKDDFIGQASRKKVDVVLAKENEIFFQTKSHISL